MKRDLVQLSENVYDVLVIGGGIYGTFIAWDAALRGLSVALVEKGDFGHATSSNTLMIIHGGLRYIQHGDIRRMRRLIRERTIFMQIAPHLVHPLPFLIPTYKRLMRGKAVLSLALLINDIFGFDRNRLADSQKQLPRGRSISREECLRLFPGVDENELTGGVIYYDCQMYNSDRLILSVARSAAKAGADMANYVKVTKLLREGTRVAGVAAQDVLTGEELDIRAQVVVNASGPWSEQVLGSLNSHHPNGRLPLSKAFNLLVNRQLVPEYAVGVYSKGRFKDQDAIISKGSRLLFITPWHKRSLIGTEHLPYDGDADNFKVTEEEIQNFLDEINDAYPTAGLKHQDVCAAYSGLLPMVATSDRTGDVQLVKHYRIHDYQKEEGIEGLVSVIGVKFTEARHVAEKTVNLIFRKLGRKPTKSATATTPLYGGQIERFDDFLAQQIEQRFEELDVESIRHLIYRYGSEYPGVLKYLNKDTESTQATTDVPSIIKAEILHGIREEMAQKLADVVFRRTELGIAGNSEDRCLQTLAAIMSKEMDWDDVRTQRELEEVRTVFSMRT
ncbi:MAG: FAD-dependent oxidoreductase [Candidatus Zixiibacteriota bacterium]